MKTVNAISMITTIPVRIECRNSLNNMFENYAQYVEDKKWVEDIEEQINPK